MTGSDVEKTIANNYDDEQPGAVPGETFEYGHSFYAKLQRLAGKIKVEQRGIERVPEDERTDNSLLSVSSMWLAANMVVTSFAIGELAYSLFGLGFVDGILVTFFFNVLSILTVCFFTIYGAEFGLRQMVVSRYWFGWWGVKIIACFNVLACIGWSCANSIVGAQLLHAVNNDVPGYAGLIIIAFCTMCITFFGYKVVHAYEFWSWIPTFIVFLITLGVFAHSGNFRNIPMQAGKAELGGVLSYGATVYGYGTGWTSYAADYSVYQPPNRNRVKLFLVTGAGLLFPLLFVEMLGVAVMTATSIDGGNNRFAEGYAASGTGGLLAAVLIPPLGGFGKFCLVILSLSIVANNCPNIYSVGLTLMVMARWTRKVPRFVYTILCTGISIAISIPGYSHYESVLENFMDFIGYWLAIYEGIALTDHFVFKRGFGGYDLEIYDQPDKLPPGIAATFAFCCGIAGMVTGMSQSWWVGPIALYAGVAPFGGDVGFELGFAFASVGYLLTRPLEIRYFGR